MGFPALAKQDLVAALKGVGVEKGHMIYVASFMPVFGNSPTLVPDTLDALKQVVGEGGTIVMPVFNWDYCKGSVFDVGHTPSQTGVLTEAFRTSEKVLRSVTPPWCTFAAWGQNAGTIAGIKGTSSFGSDGIPQYLSDHNARYVLLGSTYNQSCIHVHWLEEKFRVPYRFWKQFKGKVKMKDNGVEDVSYMYARRLDLDVGIDSKHLTDIFDASGRVQSVKLGFGMVKSFWTKDYVAFMQPYFERDKLAVLKPEFRHFFKDA